MGSAYDRGPSAVNTVAQPPVRSHHDRFPSCTHEATLVGKSSLSEADKP